jgi:hypothetical protein
MQQYLKCCETMAEMFSILILWHELGATVVMVV